MSHYILVFVASDLTLDEFAQELEMLLGTSLRANSENTKRWYEASPPDMWLELFDNPIIDYEESAEDVDYSAYSYEILLAGKINYWVEREKRLYEYAHFVFDKLKQQGKYHVLLDDDQAGKLDEFTPEIPDDGQILI